VPTCNNGQSRSTAIYRNWSRKEHWKNCLRFRGTYSTTQLYNTRFVYNYKRHGEFKLGNRSFQFVRKPYVPNKLTSALLLVDLVNNLERLAEDQSVVMERVKEKAREMDAVSLRKLANRFGKVRTRKLFNALLAN
jgi:hypothetical protein